MIVNIKHMDFTCSSCGKKYKTYRGLTNHQEKCTNSAPQPDVTQDEVDDIPATSISKLMLANVGTITKLLDENMKLHIQSMEYTNQNQESLLKQVNDLKIQLVSLQDTVNKLTKINENGGAKMNSLRDDLDNTNKQIDSLNERVATLQNLNNKLIKTNVDNNKKIESLEGMITKTSSDDDTPKVPPINKTSSNKCPICMTNDSRVVSVSCGHFQSCVSCNSEGIKNCVICRKTIRKRIEVYV